MFGNQAEFFQRGYIPMIHDCQQHAAGGLGIGLGVVCWLRRNRGLLRGKPIRMFGEQRLGSHTPDREASVDSGLSV
jgi:hypothetical protein